MAKAAQTSSIFLVRGVFGAHIGPHPTSLVRESNVR
jgi:hypothetical protein